MSDDLTRAIAEALADDAALTEALWLDVQNGAERIAAAIAPLIEARVREARAEALTEVAESLRDSAATVEKAKGATQRTWFMREMVGVLTNRAREVRRG